MPVEQAVPLFCKVLEGIDHAHEEGIVHRDIKPANMMLTARGRLKVLDFGIARILGTARMTKAGHLIGTIEYMAPEQVKGLETDARSDIYSLGMLLYEMLTGRGAFDIENEFELMSAQINQMPTPPRELNPNIPVEVEAAIMRAIAKNPDERYQTAGEFREVLLAAGFTDVVHHAVAADQNNPYATRASNTMPPLSRPATPVPSAGSDTAKETRIGTSPVTPPPAGDNGPKATRLGVAGAALSAPAPAGAKATRLGTAAPTETMPGAAYQAAGAAQTMPGAQVPQGSFFSKLTPVHYIGAGVAALVVLGVLITIPLLLLGGAKKEESAKPVVTQPAAETPVAPPPVTVPTTQQAETQQPSSGGGGDSAVLPSASDPSAVKTGALPLGGLTIDSPKSTAGAAKPAAAKPAAPSKPRNNDAAAAEARRKREAALRALDQ
jgi:hypothetical protein